MYRSRPCIHLMLLLILALSLLVPAPLPIAAALNLSGTWHANPGGGHWRTWKITQSGSTLSGSAYCCAGGSDPYGRISGTVSGTSVTLYEDYGAAVGKNEYKLTVSTDGAWMTGGWKTLGTSFSGSATAQRTQTAFNWCRGATATTRLTLSTTVQDPFLNANQPITLNFGEPVAFAQQKVDWCWNNMGTAVVGAPSRSEFSPNATSYGTGYGVTTEIVSNQVSTDPNKGFHRLVSRANVRVVINLEAGGELQVPGGQTFKASGKVAINQIIGTFYMDSTMTKQGNMNCSASGSSTCVVVLGAVR